ncbi:hypothetical protein GCM10027026_10150 [Myroides odoratimimus subsp. xuanwuensis]
MSQDPAASDGRSAESGQGGAGTTPAPPAPVLAGPRRGEPRRIAIPKLSVEAPVVGVEAPQGTLTPPSDPGTLGWWAGGVPPGAARGSVVLAGHTVNGGDGALNDLEELRQGDLIEVQTAAGRIDYRVTTVQTFSKGALATRATRLFSQESPGRLVLVTCKDWDGTRYLSNVVVLASPGDS